MGNKFASECFHPGVAFVMQTKVVMPNRRGFNCSHCQHPIKPDDIVVKFDNAASIHVRCWRVNIRPPLLVVVVR
jgi:hypothetical protein